jgi:hypothetical protein
MDYLGEWGGGGPGHSCVLKWHERVLLAGPLRRNLLYLATFRSMLKTLFCIYSIVKIMVYNLKNQVQFARAIWAPECPGPPPPHSPE